MNNLAKKSTRPTFDARTGDLSQLRQLAVAQLADDRTATQRGILAEQQEKEERACQKFTQVLEKKFGIVNAVPTAFTNGPEATIDGITFVVTENRDELRVVWPCPDCEARRWSMAINDLSDLAWVLEDPEASSVGHRHYFDDNSTDPRAPHNQPQPEPIPAAPTREERLEQLLCLRRVQVEALQRLGDELARFNGRFEEEAAAR